MIYWNFNLTVPYYFISNEEYTRMITYGSNFCHNYSKPKGGY